MSAGLVYFSVGAGLTIGVGILMVSILFLQTARRYVDLAERRLELLREGEAFLLKIVQRQGRALERNREAQQHDWVPEVVGYRLGQQDEGPAGSTPPEDRDRPAEGEEQERAPKPDAEAPQPKDGAPLLGVQVPHPDDDVPGRGWNNSPAKFFQKCYDRYLEHYEGYVRLAERLHSTRDEVGADDLGRREWEDKLRRAYDAIQRTTQRLDVLEEHYPELATDNDRISSRIGTARLHASLAERFGHI